MANDSKRLDDVTVMICHHLYQTENILGLAIAHSIIGAALVILFLMVIFFSRKLQLFLVKERAPLLALAQLIAFLMTILVPYSVELLRIFGVTWEVVGPDNFERKAFKSLYTVSRSICYLIFLFRYASLTQGANHLRELEDLEAKPVSLLASHAQREAVAVCRLALSRSS
jgi:hypothetical protein